ncbi:MAG: DUF177 domain-containing protein [Hyphomicrobiales bacterium]
MKQGHKPPQVEFSRPLILAKVPKLGAHETVTATADECRKLARRFNLPAVHGLTAKLAIKPWRGGGYTVKGEAMADIEQESVVSLEAFRSTVTFPVERYFLPHVSGSEEDAADVDEIVNGEIDLGEVVAESVALELDPYPRKPGEAFEGLEEPESGEGTVSPFARPETGRKG